MIDRALEKLADKISLDPDEMSQVMDQVMSGEANHVQIASLLTALRIKGETIDEITAAARIMREKVTTISITPSNDTLLLDTCGTGGDQKIYI